MEIKMTNPYDILKISSDSSKAEIDASYCRLMEEYTREKSGDNVTNDIAEYKINELKTAYNQIIDQLKNNSALMGQVSYDSINPYYIASASPTVNSSKTVNNDAPDKTEEIHEASRSDYSKAPENNTNQNNDNYDYNDVFGSVKQLIDLGRYK